MWSIQKVYKPAIVPHVTWLFDQLRVDYRMAGQTFLHTLFISPEDKVAFLYDLAGHADDLEVVDDMLVRHR